MSVSSLHVSAHTCPSDSSTLAPGRHRVLTRKRSLIKSRHTKDTNTKTGNVHIGVRGNIFPSSVRYRRAAMGYLLTDPLVTRGGYCSYSPGKRICKAAWVSGMTCCSCRPTANLMSASLVEVRVGLGHAQGRGSPPEMAKRIPQYWHRLRRHTGHGRNACTHDIAICL